MSLFLELLKKILTLEYYAKNKTYRSEFLCVYTKSSTHCQSKMAATKFFFDISTSDRGDFLRIIAIILFLSIFTSRHMFFFVFFLTTKFSFFFTFQHQTTVISRASSRSPCFSFFFFFSPFFFFPFSFVRTFFRSAQSNATGYFKHILTCSSTIVA